MRYIRLIRQISNWLLYLQVKFGLTDKDPLLFASRSGVRIEVPKRLLHTFKEVFMDECYLRGMPVLIPANPTIVDIGANAGFYSLQALSRYRNARIYSYEPVPVNFRQLKRNVSLNGHGEIQAVQSAVYDQSGDIELFLDPEDVFTTSASAITQHSDKDIAVKLPCTSFDDLLATHDIRCCDMLKIDCEGAEYAILYNASAASLGKIRQMVIEVHKGAEENQNIGALGSFLNRRGFRTKAIGDLLWAWQNRKGV